MTIETIISNRIPLFIDIVSALDSPGKKQQVALRIAAFASPAMQRLLEEEAPEGSRWTEPYHGRPSIRLGHGPLAENWETPDIQRTDDGAMVVFANRAEHIDYVMRQIAPHDEPLDPPNPMIFFWFKIGDTVRAEHVDHPGTAADPFVDRAFEPRGKEEFLSSLREEVPLMFSDLREFLGGAA